MLCMVNTDVWYTYLLWLIQSIIVINVCNISDSWTISTYTGWHFFHWPATHAIFSEVISVKSYKLFYLQSFTDTASILTALANKRQKDLCQDRQRERIITALNLLKKSIPSMSAALQSCIKYPCNPQAQVSVQFLFPFLLNMTFVI